MTFKTPEQLVEEYGADVVQLGYLLAKGTALMAAMRAYATIMEEDVDRESLEKISSSLGALLYEMTAFMADRLKIQSASVVKCATDIDSSVDSLIDADEEVSILMQRFGVGQGKPS